MKTVLLFFLYFLIVIIIFNMYPILTIEPENLDEHFKITFIASVMVGLYLAIKVFFIKVLSTTSAGSKRLRDSLTLLLYIFKRYWYIVLIFVSVNLALVIFMYYIVTSKLVTYSVLLGVLSSYMEILLFYLISPLILFNDTIRHSDLLSRILKVIATISIPWLIISFLTMIIVDPLILSISEPLDYLYFYPWSESNIYVYRQFHTIPIPSIGNILSVIPISLYNRWILKILAKNK